MPKLIRALAATAAGALVLAAVAMPADAKPGRTAPRTAAAAGYGCTTTVTDSPARFGWTYRTTYEYCPGLGDAQVESSCLTVEDLNPAAVPPVKVLLPKTCHYGRLR